MELSGVNINRQVKSHLKDELKPVIWREREKERIIRWMNSHLSDAFETLKQSNEWELTHTIESVFGIIQQLENETGFNLIGFFGCYCCF